MEDHPTPARLRHATLPLQGRVKQSGEGAKALSGEAGEGAVAREVASGRSPRPAHLRHATLPLQGRVKQEREAHSGEAGEGRALVSTPPRIGRGWGRPTEWLTDKSRGERIAVLCICGASSPGNGRGSVTPSRRAPWRRLKLGSFRCDATPPPEGAART